MREREREKERGTQREKETQRERKQRLGESGQNKYTKINALCVGKTIWRKEA